MRAFALAAVLTLAVAGNASAERWVKYTNGDNGTEWSYDADYSYRDKASGRVVVMKAISKPSAGIAPGGPDKGVGFVDAIDCRAKNSLQVAAYKPSTGLAEDANWRGAKAKPMDAPLGAAVCKAVASLPEK
jgi:hypothetical protein